MSKANRRAADTDVIVVGGGMAGCALAYALARNYRVLVLEKQPETSRQNRIGESLPAAALRSLRMLGLSHVLDQSSNSDYHGVVSIWGQSTPIRKDFFDSLEGPGLHLDRGSLNRAIKQAAINAGVIFMHDVQLKSLNYDSGEWAIQAKQFDQPHALTARFVVDASGRANVVARKLGLQRVNADRAVAIHAQCSAAVPSDISAQHSYAGTTLIEAVENGWWYRAPLPNAKHILSFHTDSDLPSTAEMQKPIDWLAALRSTKLIVSGIDLPKESKLNITVCAA